MATVKPFSEIKTIDEALSYAAAAVGAALKKCPQAARYYQDAQTMAFNAKYGLAGATFFSVMNALQLANKVCSVSHTTPTKPTQAPATTPTKPTQAPATTPTTTTTAGGIQKAGLGLVGVIGVGLLTYLLLKKKGK